VGIGWVARVTSIVAMQAIFICMPYLKNIAYVLVNVSFVVTTKFAERRFKLGGFSIFY
jgi:hypothetical protein